MNFEGPVATNPNIALIQKMNDMDRRLLAMERSKELIVTPLQFGTDATLTTPLYFNAPWSGGRTFLCLGGAFYLPALGYSGVQGIVTASAQTPDGNYVGLASTASGNADSKTGSQALFLQFMQVDNVYRSSGISPGTLMHRFSVSTNNGANTGNAVVRGFFIEWPTS
jgi:hypothetical protein